MAYQRKGSDLQPQRRILRMLDAGNLGESMMDSENVGVVTSTSTRNIGDVTAKEECVANLADLDQGDMVLMFKYVFKVSLKLKRYQLKHRLFAKCFWHWKIENVKRGGEKSLTSRYTTESEMWKLEKFQLHLSSREMGVPSHNVSMKM